MPSFEALPKPTPEKLEQEQTFKIIEKRVGPQALGEAETELEKRKAEKEFEQTIKEAREEQEKMEAMSPEEREKLDKARGFSVKDKRRFLDVYEKPVPDEVVDIQEYKERKAREQKVQARVEKGRLESPPPVSAFERWRVVIDGIKGELNKVRVEMKYAKSTGRVTLEYPRLRKHLIELSENFGKELSNLIWRETVQAKRDDINREAAELRQQIFELKSEIDKTQNIKHPFRFFRKLFGRK